jgi:uncharacterized heparinase superfamily protein
VWSSFRVAKRAHINKLTVTEKENMISVIATHNGYARLKKGLFHERKWVISENKIEITDFLNKSVGEAYVYFHLHPDCTIISDLDKKIKIRLKNNAEIDFETRNNFLIIENEYAESFGILKKTEWG